MLTKVTLPTFGFGQRSAHTGTLYKSGSISEHSKYVCLSQQFQIAKKLGFGQSFLVAFYFTKVMLTF